MLLGSLLAIVFDQVYFWLTVESTNCPFDLEQAEGSLDRSCLVQLIPFLPPSSLSFSIWMSTLESVLSLVKLFLPWWMLTWVVNTKLPCLFYMYILHPLLSFWKLHPIFYKPWELEWHILSVTIWEHKSVDRKWMMIKVSMFAPFY